MAAENARGPSLLVLRSSMAQNSLLRLAGDAVVIAGAFLTSVITARNLGPSSKGALSTLSYLVALAAPIASIGAGEAGVALVATKQASPVVSLRAAITVLLVGGLIVSPLVYAASAIPALGTDFADAGRVAAAIAVIPTAALAVLPHFIELRGRFWASLIARIAAASVTFLATLLLVAGKQLDVAGGMAAAAAGAVTGTLLMIIGARRAGLSIRPTLDLTVLRSIMRLGIPVQLGLLAMVGAARADLLVVAALRASADVGLYSVSLSVAQLVTVIPVAISVAIVPRIATAGGAGGRLVRRALAAAVVSASAVACVLALLVPWLIPAAFGDGFRGAVIPTVGLLPSGVLQGAQWVAARSAAARGVTKAFARTFSTSLGTMLVGDVLLVPAFGLAGAVIAVTVASAAGALVAIRDVRPL